MREVQLRRIAERKFPAVLRSEESPSEIALSGISLQPFDVPGVDDLRTKNSPSHKRGEEKTGDQVGRRPHEWRCAAKPMSGTDKVALQSLEERSADGTDKLRKLHARTRAIPSVLVCTRGVSQTVFQSAARLIESASEAASRPCAESTSAF